MNNHKSVKVLNCGLGIKVVDEKEEDIYMPDGTYGEFENYLDAMADKYPSLADFIEKNKSNLAEEARRMIGKMALCSPSVPMGMGSMSAVQYDVHKFRRRMGCLIPEITYGDKVSFFPDFMRRNED